MTSMVGLVPLLLALAGLLFAVGQLSQVVVVASRAMVAQSGKPATKLDFETSIGRQRPLHLLVAAMEVAPFMMLRQKQPSGQEQPGGSKAPDKLPDESRSGKLEWFGYCMDFMEELVQHLPYNVTYEIYRVAGNHYGIKHNNDNNSSSNNNNNNNNNNSSQQNEDNFEPQDESTHQAGQKIWNGIVGELQQGNAHLALAPLSVMAERELVIDFTVPFYDLVGSQILIKRPEVPDDYFKFLTVLDGQVWLSIGVAYLVTSAVIFLFDRLSPYSRKNSARLKRLNLDIQSSPDTSSGYSKHGHEPLFDHQEQGNNQKGGPEDASSLARHNNHEASAASSSWSWRQPLKEARRRSSLLVATLGGSGQSHQARFAISSSVAPQQQQLEERPSASSELLQLASWTGDRKTSGLYGFESLGSRAFETAAADKSGETGDHDKGRPDFGLRDSLWFCITSLTPQGGGEAPSNLSGRLVAGAWWLFCFIIIASYTANLAAFLTVSRLDIPIESMDDLIKQYRIKYAPLEHTAEHAYFERMAYIEEIFYNIWKDMSLNETLSEEERAKFAVWDYPISDKYTKVWAQIRQAGMPRTYDEAMARVRASNLEDGFALLTDAMVIKYAAMTDCSLKPVGDEFSRKPIALGVQKNLGRLRDDISHAILQLINQRFMETLREKWWTNNPDRVVCENSDQSEGISIKNIGGVFIIIIAGVLLSFVVWSIERLAYKTKIEISQSLVDNVDNPGNAGNAS